jgi:type I restriction enzyme R subunit
VRLAFDGTGVPPEHLPRLKRLISRVVDILQDTIGIIDFWKKPIEVKKLRGNIDTEILLAGIPQLAERHERIAVEIVKLAEKRHNELTR